MASFRFPADSTWYPARLSVASVSLRKSGSSSTNKILLDEAIVLTPLINDRFIVFSLVAIYPIGCHIIMQRIHSEIQQIICGIFELNEFVRWATNFTIVKLASTDRIDTEARCLTILMQDAPRSLGRHLV